MVEHLTSRVKIIEAITEANGVAGMADINGSIVDMSGFEAIAFVVIFGAIVGTAVTGIRIQRDVDVAGGTMADIEGSAQAIADTDDGKIVISDVYRPGERYVRGVVDRGTANATVRAAFYILYGSHEHPVSGHGATVVVEQLKDKPEGTA